MPIQDPATASCRCLLSGQPPLTRAQTVSGEMRAGGFSTAHPRLQAGPQEMEAARREARGAGAVGTWPQPWQGAFQELETNCCSTALAEVLHSVTNDRHFSTEIKKPPSCLGGKWSAVEKKKTSICCEGNCEGLLDLYSSQGPVSLPRTEKRGAAWSSDRE